MQSYDGLKRLTQVVNKKTGGADLNKFAYAYDNRDVRTGVQMKYGSDPLRQVDYTYDTVNQLVGEAATGGVAATNYSNAYSYDAMGNRLKRENTQGTTTALTRSGVNELNQLTSVSTSVDSGPRVTGGMSYDAAGNLTETSSADGSRTLYVYDDADRLFRIEKRNANDAPVSKSEFVYDYASRKAVSQEFTYTAGAWVQSSEKRRVFFGMDVIQERGENNYVMAQLVRDGNIGGILSRSTAVGASFFSYDGAGNVTLLTDASGNEIGRYRYDAFGNTLEIAGLRAADNPYRFSTKELHAQSGLYDFGFRFYSSSLGRWINRDPIREAGGINLYSMVANDPVNSSDSYGLKDTPDERTTGQIRRDEARSKAIENSRRTSRPPGLFLGPNEYWDPTMDDPGVLGRTSVLGNSYYGPSWAASSPTVRESIRAHERVHRNQPKWWVPLYREKLAYIAEKKWLEAEVSRKWPKSKKFPNGSYGDDYDECQFRLSEIDNEIDYLTPLWKR